MKPEQIKQQIIDILDTIDVSEYKIELGACQSINITLKGFIKLTEKEKEDMENKFKCLQDKLIQ